MNQYEKQGFDFDPELIDLFDSILQNINDDDDLTGEFKKLKFIKQLDGTYNSSPGPLKQLIEKMGTMEHKFSRVQLDMQRAIRDMIHATRTIREAANAQSKDELLRKIKELEGLEAREQFYTWNEKNGT